MIKGAGLSALLLFALIACKTLSSSKLKDDNAAGFGLRTDIERLDPSPKCGFAEAMIPTEFDQWNRIDQASLMGPQNYNKIYKPACENINFVDHDAQKDSYKFRYYVMSFYIVMEESRFTVDDCGVRSADQSCSRAAPLVGLDATQNARSCSAFLNDVQADLETPKVDVPSGRIPSARPITPKKTPVGVLRVLIDGYNSPQLARHVLTLAKTGSFDDGFIDLPSQANHNLSFSMRGYRSRQYGIENRSARVINISASTSSAEQPQGFRDFQLYAPTVNAVAPFHYVALNGLLEEAPEGTFGRVLCFNDDGAALFPDLCSGITKLACSMKNAKGQTSRECARYANAPKLEQLKIGCAAVSGPLTVDFDLQKDTGGKARYFINPTDTKLKEIKTRAEALVKSEGNPAGAHQ